MKSLRIRQSVPGPTPDIGTRDENIKASQHGEPMSEPTVSSGMIDGKDEGFEGPAQDTYSEEPPKK